MRRELLIEVGAGQTRAALVEDGRLAAYGAEPAIGQEGGRPGDVYLARVAKIVPAMQAAFVDLGLPRDGFLSLRDAPGALHEGQAVLVQITREAQGDKGPKLTARLALSPELEAARGRERPPCRLRAGPGLIARMLADAPKDTAILIDDAGAAAAARRTFPHLAIAATREDLFARHDLEEQVAALSRPRVPLACGGWITIQPTEGMTAIDVNSGGFAAAGGREETARTVNLEAAQAIGRQLRLRGIGGLIVADFIQMEDGRPVVAALKQTLGEDSRISPMAEFGIVAIARRRRNAPLAARQVCGHCGGSGQASTVQAVALEILRQIERSARAAPGRAIVVRAPPPVVAWLTAHEAAVRAGLDRRGVGRVRYNTQQGEDFDVGTE